MAVENELDRKTVRSFSSIEFETSSELPPSAIVKTSVLTLEEAASEILNFAFAKIDDERQREELLQLLTDLPLPEAPDSPYVVGLRFFWTLYDLPPYVFTADSLSLQECHHFFIDTFGFRPYTAPGKTVSTEHAIVQTIGQLILDKVGKNDALLNEDGDKS